MAGSCGFWFPSLPSSLQDLDLSNCLYVDRLSDISYANIISSPLPKLRSLSIRCNYHIFSEHLWTLLGPSEGNIEKLNIGGCNNPGVTHWNLLISRGILRNTTNLNLSFCDINDQTLILLAANAPRLRLLDLNSTMITGVGVKALFSNLDSKLKRLNLNSCKLVSIDAVEYARSHSVKVEFYFPDTVRGKKCA